MDVDQSKTLLQEIVAAKRIADRKGGTTGKGTKLVENPYFPYDIDGISMIARGRLLDEMWNNDDPGKKTVAKSKAKRAQMYDIYNVQPHVQDMIESRFKFIHQGAVGGCFFTSIINILQMGGFGNQVDSVLQDYGSSLTKLKNPKEFKKLYIKTLGLADEGYSSYLNPVQILTEIIPDFMELTNEVGFTWFRYQALGRASRRAGPFNSIIADGAETTEEYNEKILAYLRRLLDEGYVFATPFNGHFVVYIGYTADGFLALGSYGQHADKGGLHPIRETTFLADAVRSCLFIKVPRMSAGSARAPSRLHGMSQDLGQPAYW